MENSLVKLIDESGLDKAKSGILLEKFANFFEIAEDWKKKADAIVVSSYEHKAEMKMAREGRLFLKDKRVAVEKTRKALKENALREGQTIDSIAKVLTSLITPIENDLEQKEKFIEIQEEKRKTELERTRIEVLSELNVPHHLYDLKNMSDTDFTDLVNGLKSAIQARIEAEKKAEEERIAKVKAEEEERERIRIENEKLKAEAAEREKEMAIERAKLEAEREKLEAKIRAKAEAEANAKRDAEIKAQEEKRQRILAELAPDKDKLNELADKIMSIHFPDVKSNEAQSILINIINLLEKVVKYIHEQTNKL